MVLLSAGVLLWSVAHLFKRIAPSARANLGAAGRPLMAVAILASIVMMVMGYQGAPMQFFWGRTVAMAGINNLLVLLAVYLMAASVGKTWITGKVRHPQLTAVKSWAVGHLLVNGDTASFILFGGLVAWAVISVILIGKQDGKPALSVQTTALREVITAVAAVLVYGGIAHAHAYLGYPVFG